MLAFVAWRWLPRWVGAQFFNAKFQNNHSFYNRSIVSLQLCQLGAVLKRHEKQNEQAGKKDEVDGDFEPQQ